MKLKGYQNLALPGDEEQGGGYFVTVAHMADGKAGDEA